MYDDTMMVDKAYYNELKDKAAACEFWYQKYYSLYLPLLGLRDKAEWVDNKCSVCGKGIENLIESREWYENEKPNYCPFCGTRFIMKGSDAE